MKNSTTFTREEAFTLLNNNSIESSSWQSLLGGNQKFWTVKAGFNLNDYELPNDSLTRFDVWGSDDNGNTIVRCWSKW